mgnify:FL=1
MRGLILYRQRSLFRYIGTLTRLPAGEALPVFSSLGLNLRARMRQAEPFLPERIAMTNKLLVFVLLTLHFAAANAQVGPANADLAGTRPNAGGEADEITVRFGLLDIPEINDREQVFMADIFFHIEWRDSRLAVDDPGVGLRTFAIDEIWHPRLTIVNNRGVDFLLPWVATVDGEGNVIVRQRLSGPLGVDLDLRAFPYDTQRLRIDVVSYQYTPEEIRFTEDSEVVANLDQRNDDAWAYELLEPESYEYRLSDGGRGAAGLIFTVVAEREASYYLITLGLPMTLILFLAWMTHWLPVDVVPARMGTASATVFSLIAFGVSFRLTLPKIAYLTAADRFVLYSTSLVFVSLAVIVLTIRWANNDRIEDAERLASRARLAFPFLYGVIVLLTIAMP